ncbi:hypothetical protein ACU686_01255 [Yinghuangia aomiensis]
MDTRRIRRTPLPTLAVVALAGTLLAACGSEKADDNDRSGGNTASVLLHPAAAPPSANSTRPRRALRKRLDTPGSRTAR